MSRKYKFYNKEGLYFVSFATIGWIDVFVREAYFQIPVWEFPLLSPKDGDSWRHEPWQPRGERYV